MSHHPEMQVYIKPGCPWCVDALAYLDREGYRYRAIDVTADRSAWEEMKRLFGQTLAPSLTVGPLRLADFGVDELVPFLETHDIRP